MTNFHLGFASEVTKLAGLENFIRRLSHSPELRASIRRAAVLGGGTGAVAGALGGKAEDESRLKKILGGAAMGALTGGISGAAFPGWFNRGAMRAHGETP